MDGVIWWWFRDRGWPIELQAARLRFRCRECGGNDVLILPARRPKRDRSNAAVDLVAGYFHHMRAQAKKRRR